MDPWIEIKGNKAKIFNENNYVFLDGLDLELSYRLEGIEFSPAVRKGRWNGQVHLLKSNLIFPIGLVPRVVEYYKQSNRNISVIDKNTYETPTPIDISKRLKELKKEPREYQLSALKTILEKRRLICKLATGGGKTILAAMIIAAMGKRTIFFVTGVSLLYQTHEIFEKIFQKKIGIIGDSHCEIEDITVASIWSLGKIFGMGKGGKSSDDDENDTKEKDIEEKYHEKIKSFIRSSVVNIFDEVHLSSAETFQRISAEMCGQIEIGLSASPYRSDGCNLLIESIFGKVGVDIPASELIEKGFLVKPVIKFISVSKPKFLLEKNYKEIYKNYIVHNEERNNLVVQGAIALVKQNFITMILYKEIFHGEILYNKLQEKGLRCYMLNGSNTNEQRQQVIDEVLSGECKLLLASSIFDLGIDLPILSGLILAGGGKSQIRAIQRIGRAIRPAPGKDMAAIIDFHDRAKYLKDHYLIRKRTYQSEPGFVIEE